MTTKNSKTGTTKTKKTTTAAAPAKVTSGTKRAVKRERVQMVKPTPSSPMPAPVFDAPAPVVQAAKVELNVPAATATKPVVNGAANVAMKTTTAQKTETRIERADFELLVRRAAYQLAQRRQFRGGTPAQDWFAAEAAVKADLQARGITLAS